MNHDLKPYPEYRESGVPWLGLVPKHWEVRRNGRLFAQRVETGFGDLPILEVSLRTGVRVRNFEDSKRKQVMSDREKYKRAAKGDIAYNMMRLWQGAIGVAPEDGLISPAYVVGRPFEEAESRFFVYLFRTDAYMSEVNKYSRGIVSDRNRLYWDEFKQMPSPFPPTGEQRLIATFLDALSRKVNRFVRNRRRFIEVLNEQKQAIIDRAITRGLDPTVKLKPSGIAWLGDVPEHWDLKPLKRLARMESGESITELKIGESGDFPVYGGNGLRGYTSAFTHDGDYVLIGRQGALCGNVNCVTGKFWASEHAIVPTLQGVNNSWFGELIRTMNLRQYSMSAAQPGLSIEMISQLRAPVPSIEEQVEIAEWIRSETRTLSTAIGNAQREIALVQEYRTRLIADVVTGKVDVRHFAADLGPEGEPWDDTDALLDEVDTEDPAASEEGAADVD